jgi:hypothetical protein
VALVGEAHIVVRAITNKVAGDIKNGFSGIADIGDKAGADVGKSFSRGFSKNSKSMFDSQFIKNALKANEALVSITRTGRTVGTSLAALVSSVGALAGGLVALGAAALSAGPSLVALGGIFAAIGIGAITAKLALGGVGAAVGKLNKAKTKAAKDDTAQKRRVFDAEKALALVIEKNAEAALKYDKDLDDSKKKVTEAQLDYNKAVAEGNEELQQLGFDAEDAALAEKKAAIELEKARETLQRTQDLPPNSRARKEAELAYAEAELNLRKAKDANSDLAAEQDRLAKTGVKGTDVVIAAQEKLNSALDDQKKLAADRSKEIRDGIRSEEDATLDLKRANEDLAKAQAGGADDAGNDPLEGLTESQKKFAKFLSGLKPKVDEIKEAAAGAFLPKLQEGIEIVAEKGFPVIKQGVKEVGDALGDAAIEIAKAITEGGNLKDLATVFTNAAESIRTLGSIVGNLWGVFLGVLKAVNPLVEKFLGWLDKVTEKWEKTLDTDAGQKKLTDFFNEAGRVAAEIGKIIGNIAGGLGNIIKANTGPGTGGQIMLDYFRDITQAFKDFSGSDSGQKQLKGYFADVAENSKAILGSVGAFVKEILKAGADPNIKIFWDTLKQGAPLFGDILKSSNEALPSLGKLIVKILELVKIFTDSGAITVFFDTLSKAADVVIKVMENPVVKSLVEKIGRVLAFFSAVGLVFTALKFGVSAVVGGFAKIGMAVSKGVGIVKDPFGALRTGSGLTRTELKKQMIVDAQKKTAMEAVGTAGQRAAAGIKATGASSAASVPQLKAGETAVRSKSVAMTALGTAGRVAGAGMSAAGKGLALLGGPLGIVLLLLPLIISNWDKIKEVIGKFINWLKENWPLVLAIITGPIGLAVLAVVKNWDKIKEAVSTAITKIKEVGAKIWDWIKDKLSAAWELVKTAFITYITFVTGLPARFVTAGAKLWDWVKDKLTAVWALITTLFTEYVTFVTSIPGKFVTAGGKIWSWVSDKLGDAFTAVKTKFDEIVTWVTGLPSRIKGASVKLWDGLKDSFVTAINFIIGKWNDLQFDLRFPNSIFGIPLGPLAGKGFTLDTPNIKPLALAMGGIIPATPGGMLARIGEAGRAERVEPLDPDGLSKRDKAMIQMLSSGAGGGMTINVYPSPGMNETELADIVSRKIAFAMRKGAIV